MTLEQWKKDNEEALDQLDKLALLLCESAYAAGKLEGVQKSLELVEKL